MAYIPDVNHGLLSVQFDIQGQGPSKPQRGLCRVQSKTTGHNTANQSIQYLYNRDLFEENKVGR